MKIKTGFGTVIPYELAVKLCKKENCDEEQIEFCFGKDYEEEISDSVICSSAYLERIYNNEYINDEEL